MENNDNFVDVEICEEPDTFELAEKKRLSKEKRVLNKQKALAELKLNKVSYGELRVLDEGYQEKLNNDPKYSLDVDPENIFYMDDEQKRFIRYYVQLKNVGSASKLAGIEKEKGLEYFKMYSSQQEIRRINNAMHARQFSNKMLSLDEIGGFLTSIITDENIPLHDQLSVKDKLPVIRMLMDLNQLKTESYDNPTVIDAVEIETELKDLSVESIKQLIANSKNPTISEDKAKIIEDIDKDGVMTEEEKRVLEGMSVKELLEMQENINKGDDIDEKK